MTNVARKYLLDADTFIQAKRNYYGFDVCPGFWQSLLWHGEQGHVLSIDRVRDELLNGNDELRDWARDKPPSTFFVKSTEPQVVICFGQFQSWAQIAKQYLPIAKAEFASKADAWLVAYAKVHGLMVVTQETYRPECKIRVPIPNVCKAFNVDYIDVFQMLRDLRIQFTWHEPAS